MHNFADWALLNKFWNKISKSLNHIIIITSLSKVTHDLVHLYWLLFYVPIICRLIVKKYFLSCIINFLLCNVTLIQNYFCCVEKLGPCIISSPEDIKADPPKLKHTLLIYIVMFAFNGS